MKTMQNFPDLNTEVITRPSTTVVVSLTHVGTFFSQPTTFFRAPYH